MTPPLQNPLSRHERRCLCGCGQPVSVPRRKDGYRVSRKSVPVRYYASRVCAAAVARQAKARVIEQRQRLSVTADQPIEPTTCLYCGEDVLTGREMHGACAMRKARESRWTTAKPTAVWNPV